MNQRSARRIATASTERSGNSNRKWDSSMPANALSLPMGKPAISSRPSRNDATSAAPGTGRSERIFSTAARSGFTHTWSPGNCLAMARKLLS